MDFFKSKMESSSFEEMLLIPAFNSGDKLTPDIAGKQLRLALGDISYNVGYSAKNVLHPSYDEMQLLLHKTFSAEWLDKKI
ncbi:hypothetical protein K7H94_22495 (plasmid) [Pantoea dispersa]|uniref:hypothetical protein n=1 Tax=Pantoea dispersa TaxID=59814 RepID=UPI001CA67E78|nr:hypothetical protein [Pantoea dispersa]QZY92918.1 hypothetical protein K7H94_22495 [Pantoea dispersa]